MHLGAPRLSARIYAQAHRRHPHDPRVRAAYALLVLERRGALAAWRLMCATDGAQPTSKSPKERVELQTARALVLAMLRDFSRAEEALADARALDPERAGVVHVAAVILEQQDRHEEALEVARQGLAQRPLSRALTQLVAHHLVLLGQRDAALEFLTRASAALESSLVAWQLAALHVTMQRYDAAHASLQRVLELSPLLEPAIADGVYARLSDVEYLRGRRDEAIALARRVRMEVYRRLADRMAQAPAAARRVELDVPFVHQHRMTCVPATLTAISRYWSMPADHLRVADEICYDGTPTHSERSWAEQNGWRVGEFTVTWGCACALLDRGVPFVLTTAFAAEGHAQAVVGYDERRATLLIRDPARPDVAEADWEVLSRAMASTGPRGLWLVPEREAARLDGLVLPDAALWDRLYEAQRALARHRRAEAGKEVDALRAAADTHPVTLAGRRALAAYDADPVELRAAAEALLVSYPRDARAELEVVTSMGELAPRSERIARLQAIVARPDADPIFRERLAHDLHADAREHRRALRLLPRAIRARPHRGRPLGILAEIARQQQRFDEALELCRFAACLDSMDEACCRSYFIAARARGEVDQALAMLRSRVERLGQRSAGPWQTLHWALGELERAGDAASTLERALERHPEDGDLLLQAAATVASQGQVHRAEDLLARAEGRSSRAEWLRAAAFVARLRGDGTRRATLLREWLALAPLSLEAHQGIVEWLAATEGREAALAHLEQAVDRTPSHRPLLHLAAEWQTKAGPEARERAARRSIAADERDAWAWRELALAMSELGRTDEALAACDRAAELQPSDVRLYAVRATILTKAGRAEEARLAWREAASGSIDFALAVGELLRSAGDEASRAADLDFVEAELRARALEGSAIGPWLSGLRGLLSPEDALARVAALRESRSDLAAAWSAHVHQLLAIGRFGEAGVLARAATARFPLVSACWIDLADALGAVSDLAGELSALERAVEVAPLDGAAIERLAGALEGRGELARAIAVLERALGGSPGHTGLAVRLARLLSREGRDEDAAARLRAAIAFDPDFDDSWTLLYEISARLGRAAQAVELAREVARAHRHSEAMARNLAAVAMAAGSQKDALAAIDQGLAASPSSVFLHDLRAMILAHAGRLDEAVAACRPAALKGAIPVELRGRAAALKLQQGDARAAADDLSALLREHPAYVWGWSVLAEARGALWDMPGVEQAAQEIIRLAPETAMAHRLVGEARLAAGDREGARSRWVRAARLPHADAMALRRLVRAAAHDGDHEAAEGWLALLRANAGENAAIVSEVWLALRRGQVDRALATFRQACATPGAERQVIRSRTLLVFGGLGAEAYGILEERARASADAHVVASLWALGSAERGDRRAEQWIVNAPQGSASARAVAIALVQRLELRGRRNAVRWLAWRLPTSVRRANDVRAALKPALALSAATKARLAQVLVAAAVLFVVGGFLALLADGTQAGASSVTGLAPMAVWGLIAFLRPRKKRGS
jgi:tetratricopeptide (TPR) repeat protein